MTTETHVDYELRNAEGKQVMFTEQTVRGASVWSNESDEAKAKTFAKDGLTLFRRTTTTTFEEVV